MAGKPVIKIKIHPNQLLELLKNKVSRPRIRNILIVLFLAALLFEGYEGIFAYQSISLVEKGDNLFSEKKYSEALEIYKKADFAWKRTFLIEKFRASPTTWRINKASTEVNRLAESHENYLTGIENFENKNWNEAVSLLSRVEDDDQNYSDAQAKIKEANKQIAAAERALKAKESQVAGASAPIIYSPSIADDPMDVFPTNPVIDPTHPIFLKASDNLGNYTIGSTGNGIPFFVKWPNPLPTLKVGQTVTIKVSASDPKGLPLQFKFMNGRNQTVQNWGSSNSYTWTVSTEDGGSPFIVPMVRNGDSILRYGDMDDSTVMHYQVSL